MLSINRHYLGKLDIAVHDYEKAGDTFDRHAHDEKTIHISIVGRGSFQVYGDGWEITAKQGEILDFKIGVFHAFKALEDNSRMINIVKM